VSVDLFGMPAPDRSGVLEVADQFALLGIDAEYRPGPVAEPVELPLQVAELAIAVRMRRPGEAFAVDVQGEVFLRNSLATVAGQAWWSRWRNSRLRVSERRRTNLAL
jgi:hypothetical protein